MNTLSTILTPRATKLGVVLVEPRIPQNVGNIGRLCACTDTNLLLVGDIGFSFSDRQVKRSGMDYLEYVNPERFADFPDLMAAYPDWTYSFLTTKAKQIHTQIPFADKHFLIFGSEETGLPDAVIERNQHHSYRIPMLEGRRSLNLSSSVSIVLYEGLRQLNQWPVGPP